MKTGFQIQDWRKLPLVTLTLALIISAIHISRMVQGEYNEVWKALTGWYIYLFDQPWRVMTTGLLHNDLVHFLDNLLFLLLLGGYNERKHGWRGMVGLFFGSVIVSEMAYIYFDHAWSEGISGFTYALFGFSLVANWRAPWWKNITHNLIHLLFAVEAIRVLVMDKTGLTEQVTAALGLQYYETAHLAHLFGVLYGLTFGLVFTLQKRRMVYRWGLVILPILWLISLLYSPWLPEWRLVKWGPILTSQQADCQHRSGEGNTSASLSIQNESDQRIAYYWLPPEGEPLFYGLIQPGAHLDDQESWISYAWCIVDADTRLAVLEIIQTEEKQTVVVGAQPGP